jgi:hypothetical protein
VVNFGLGALLLLTVIVLVPKLFSALERRQLEREKPPGTKSPDQPETPLPPSL